MIFSHRCPNWKNHRPHRRSLTDAQLVALARYTRELLPQPLWSCMKVFQTLINCPKIKFSDHKAAAGAVRRRRKRLVAAGCKPASALSASFQRYPNPYIVINNSHVRLTYCALFGNNLLLIKTYIPSTEGVEEHTL